MQKHPTVPMHPPWDVQIDVKLRPLMRLLWKRGFRTCFSCEGDADGPRDAYIRFETFIDAVLFYALAGPLAWSARPPDDWRRKWIAPDAKRHWVLAGHDVRFPQREIPLAEQALRSGVRWTVDDIIAHRVEVTHGLRPPPEMAPPRICKRCGGLIPPRTRRDAVYCSTRCRKGARRRSLKASPGTGNEAVRTGSE
jgi:hypothetical protein